MKNIFFGFLSVFIVTPIFAQSIITGTVIDGDFNEPLAFANVILRVQGSSETYAGAITDFEGNYSFDVGSNSLYEIEFSYLGYETIIVNDIQPVNGDELDVSIVLNPLANALEEVVVTTTARRNTAASVLAIQKGAVTMLDGLSVQTIKKSGDSNVASAIKRIPGVSVQGGKFVYVRGLGDRYSKTLLGGLEVPGLDPDKNTLQLDIFPTSLLDNILVNKSSSADQPADFTGGVVDVILKDFSSLPEYSVSISTSYNSETNFRSAPSLPSYSLNSFYFDSGENDLPFSSRRTIPFPETFLNPAEESILINSTDALTKQLAVSRNNNMMDASLSLSASDQFRIKENLTIGYIATASYKFDSDYYQDVYNASLSKEPEGLRLFQSQNGELGSIQAISSGLFGLAVKTPNTKHKATILAIRSGESNALDGIFEDYLENPYVGDANIMTHTERNILTLPISGSYRIGSKLTFDWQAAPSMVEVRDLDFRKTVFNILSNGKRVLDNSVTQLPTRLWRNLEETSFSGRADLKYELKTGQTKSQIKIGASYLSKDRDFTTDSFQIGYKGLSSGLNGDPNNILNPNFIWNATKDEGSYLQGEFQPTNQYESGGETIAAYLSAELKLSEKFKSILGLRYEAYSTTYTGEDIERNLYDNEVFIDVADFYPSINLIYSATDSFNLRGSYSRTTARPSFKENSSANIYDPITERFFLGNTSLNPTYINNLDLKAEYFGEGNEAASISLFYKQFNDPIEIFYYSVNTPNVLIARNNDSATVYGAELDLKKNLLDSAVDRLSFNLNASLIVSELTMGDEEYNGRKVNNPDREIDRERQLQGQSPYLINSGLSYNIFDKSLEAGLFYNVQGRALQVIGVGQFPDVYTEPFHSLNFNLSKGLGADGNKVISLKVENLLNDAIESRFDYFGDTSFLFSQLKPGINTSLGFTYKF